MDIRTGVTSDFKILIFTRDWAIFPANAYQFDYNDLQKQNLLTYLQATDSCLNTLQGITNSHITGYINVEYN
jgi:hypothetical protein